MRSGKGCPGSSNIIIVLDRSDACEPVRPTLILLSTEKEMGNWPQNVKQMPLVVGPFKMQDHCRGVYLLPDIKEI